MPKAYVIVYRGNGDDKPYEVLLGQKQVINYAAIERLAKTNSREIESWNNLLGSKLRETLSANINSEHEHVCLVCACNNATSKPNVRLKGTLSAAGGLPCFFGGGSDNFSRDEIELRKTAIRELIEELGLINKLGLEGKRGEIEALKENLLACLDKDRNTPSRVKVFSPRTSRGKATYYLLNIKNTPLEHIYSDTQNGIGGNIDLNTIKSIYNSPGDAHPETNGTYEIYQATWRSIRSLNREWARGYQDYVDFIKAETEKFSEFLLSIFNIPITKENIERLSKNLINHLMTHEEVDWNVEAAEYAQYEIANIQRSEQSPRPERAWRQRAPA